MTKPVYLAGLLALAGVFAVLTPADAQYPMKPVRLIVPFPPGGGADPIGRLVSQGLSQTLGQQVMVENRPGAGANIGAEIVAKSPADGYTLLVSTTAHAIATSLYRKLNYDLLRDFAPVTLLATTASVVVVHPSLPVKSVKDLIALARSRPAQLTYSSTGSGTGSHLAGALFEHLTGVRMTHVPYKGGGPSMIALLSGEVSLSFTSMPSATTFIQAGKLRALAVTTAQRLRSTPSLPTIGEAGVPGYDVETWYGLLVPAGTPKEIIARLHEETLKVLKHPDAIQRLDQSGYQVRISTPEEYAAFTRSEIEKWAKVVKAADMRAD